MFEKKMQNFLESPANSDTVHVNGICSHHDNKKF